MPCGNGRLGFSKTRQLVGHFILHFALFTRILFPTENPRALLKYKKESRWSCEYESMLVAKILTH